MTCPIQIIHSTMILIFSASDFDSRGDDFLIAEKNIMRSKLTLLAILAMASAAYAKDPKTYQPGKLLQMDSVSCGMAEKDAKSFAGEVLGTDSGSKRTREVLCQEYEIGRAHV